MYNINPTFNILKYIAKFHILKIYLLKIYIQIHLLEQFSNISRFYDSINNLK